MNGPSPWHLRRARVRSATGPLRADPGASALLLDIDGTLAHITKDHTRTTIPRATRSSLRRLQAEYRLVGVITGRRALNARDMVGLDIDYSGNHGLERLEPGMAAPIIEPEAMAWQPRVRAFVTTSCGPALEATGVVVEDKDLVVTLHWAAAADPARARSAALAAAGAATASGLRALPGRDIVEICPPVALDKGTAVRRLLAARPEVRHVLYAGDDVTDLDAFRALSALRSEGRLDTVVRVGVAARGGPAAIVTESDLAVRSPRGVRHLLRSLER